MTTPEEHATLWNKAETKPRLGCRSLVVINGRTAGAARII